MNTPGRIIAFYSYKGGTGRTMALANTGCVLAERTRQGRGVLMIDWDLEAPGLHRFFPDAKYQGTGHKGVSEGDVGIVDLFEAAAQLPGSPNRLIEMLERAPIPASPKAPNLHIIVAGRPDGLYAERASRLDWRRIFENTPGAFDVLSNYISQKYDYVLIDSRTGVTDIGGICTALMPEKLVTVFTPNRQSLTGALETARTAVNYRRQAGDPRPLVLYPLPSRVENSELKLKEAWRRGDAAGSIIGYQQEFESLFRECYSLKKCDLNRYFDEAEVQHVAAYSYGEKVAVLEEKSDERLSLSRSYRRFTELLVGDLQPWELGGRFDILISAAPEDSESARQLARKLRDRGIWVWHEDAGLQPGSDWRRAIGDAIKRAKVILFLATPHSIRNPNVIFELGVAEASGIRIVPIIRGVKVDDLPFLIQGLHMHEYRGTPQLASELSKLIAEAQGVS